MNNSIPERSAFEKCALVSGLLTERQLEQARAAVRWSEGDEPDENAPPSDKQLADRLVERGILNAWQAKQLLDGRTKFNLGPYLIVDSIGQGGMGQVFKAQHDKTGAIVAVKVLPRDKSTPEAVASFAREIRALESLNHPKLVAARDDGEDGNVHYLVTEYVPGMDLRKLVRSEGPLDMAAAASIISQVAEGLEYAHSKGIIHRDVKPGNVLVSPDGAAKLSDLGLAGQLDEQSEDDPRYGKIVGTADYLSPDQVRDPWTPKPAWDIYSLGCTLYYAATGKVPFPGGSTAEKARAHCDLRPLDPRRLNPRLSAEFVEVMADMMAKDSEQRIGSAREVISRLAPFISDQDWFTQSAGSMRVMVTPTRRPIPRSALADTQTDFPNVPQGVGNSAPSVEEAAAYKPNMAFDDDEWQPVQVRVPVKNDLMAVIWPLTVFVLAPLALVGAVSLLLLLVRAAM